MSESVYLVFERGREGHLLWVANERAESSKEAVEQVFGTLVTAQQENVMGRYTAVKHDDWDEFVETGGSR